MYLLVGVVAGMFVSSVRGGLVVNVCEGPIGRVFVLLFLMGEVRCFGLYFGGLRFLWV